mgnify:CR=1 FL=1
MKHITILKFRLSNEETVQTRKYENGADAVRWIQNKIRSLKLHNPTYIVEYHSINKEIANV